MLAGIIIMTPTIWMVLSSLKPSFEVTAYPPRLLFSPTLENYVELMKTTPFVSYAVNSLIVTIGSTSLGLLFGIPAAFAVSWTRISWPAILRSVDLLRFFDIIYITTQGGPGNASNTLNIYGFRVGFEFFNIGYASALMLTLTAIVFGAVLAFNRLRGAVAW